MLIKGYKVAVGKQEQVLELQFNVHITAEYVR